LLIGQLFFDGLSAGLVFVILAAGLVLIASVDRILFMAYGSFYAIGAYATWFAFEQLHLPYFIALVIGVLGVAILGMLSYILIFQRLQLSKGGFLATLIASMGLSMILSQGILLVFGNLPQKIPPIFPGMLDFWGIRITNDRLFIICVGVLITVILFWVYERTALGRSLRTVAFKPEVASLMGINNNRIYIVTLGLGTLLAGIAGGILAPSYGINPQMGHTILWTVMLMTIFGGMDSLLGAVAAGLVIGQLLSFGQFFIGSPIQIIIFLAIGIVLYFRPNGLLGRGINIGI
jgi:branched-chain amino acid transport system permease protein